MVENKNYILNKTEENTDNFNKDLNLLDTAKQKTSSQLGNKSVQSKREKRVKNTEKKGGDG